jgi:hypothetical protein
VKPPVFCTKTIGQSTPYPCVNNTLTVTLSATTDLPANITKITMSGLFGGKAESGPLQLLDKSGGQNHHLLFATGIGNAAGYGEWDNGAKTLTLQVVRHLDCGGEYFFGFELTNSNDGQDAQNITISAQNLHLYHPLTRIDATLMVPDNTAIPVERSSPGDAAPLKIWDPVFTIKEIWQSSSTPCDENIITVTIKSSVPLFAVCKPVLTLKGLMGSDTHSKHLDIVAKSTASPFENLGNWHKESGTLKLRVTSDTIETDVLSFTFKLNNPSKGQAPAPNQVKLEVKEGIVFDSLVNNVVTPFSMEVPATKTVADYPITVGVAAFTVKAIGQESPWPCDLNTISVTLVSNVTLLSACSPTVIIKGLTNMQTNSTDTLSIMNNMANQSIVNGTWDQALGTLKIDLTQFGSSSREFNFAFVLRNPSSARLAVPVHLQGLIVSANDTTVRQSTTNSSIPGSSVLMTRMNSSSNAAIAGKAEGQQALSLEQDDNVGFVRKIFFLTKSVRQSGPANTNLPTDPCSTTTITVSLAMSVPVITHCPTNLTISGLTSGKTADFADYVATPYFRDSTKPTENTSKLEFAPGSWKTADGSWVMRFAQDTLAGKVYVIEFPLRQRAQQSPGVREMKIKMGGAPGIGIEATAENDASVKQHGLGLPSTSDKHRPLKVNRLTFERKYISQSSPFPCDDNVLSVTLTVRDNAVYKDCRVNITISGLTGSQTPDRILTVDWSSNSNAVSSSWRRIPGSLILALPFETNETWRQDWALSFSLVNPKNETPPAQPTIQANLVDDFEQNETIVGGVMIRDQRRFSKQTIHCNANSTPASTNSSEWGHSGEILAIPSAEKTNASGQYI